MKYTKILLLLFLLSSNFAQIAISKPLLSNHDNGIDWGSPLDIVTVFENPNYGGKSRSLSIGSYRLSDLNINNNMDDIISSIKIPSGLYVILYENVDAGGGYGLSVDLMEDIPNLSIYNFNDKASFIEISNTPQRQGYVWLRGSNLNGQYMPPHWERQQSSGGPFNSITAAVSPYLPSKLGDTVTEQCYDLFEQLNALKNGVYSDFYPTEPNIQLRTNIKIENYKKTTEFSVLNEKYQALLIEYKDELAAWKRLPENKRPSKPIPPKSPIEEKRLILRTVAIKELIEENRKLEIQNIETNLKNLNCDVVGYGKPSPVFPNSPTLTNDIRNTLPLFIDNASWDMANKFQMGVIGSDFRGKEEVGSACFEREMKGLPFDNFNFWYPQKRANEDKYFKQTLSGKLKSIESFHTDFIFPDHDLNIDIEPSQNSLYLTDEAHKFEITPLSDNAFKKGDCIYSHDTKWFKLEGEIRATNEAQLVLENSLKNFTKERNTFYEQYKSDICLYGTWIYDKGHCDQPEIHPAEQIWWSNSDELKALKTATYSCNLFCDASERFWWRKNMDDGTKLKPWGAPPIRGIFAIAFEAQIGMPAKKYEIVDINKHNVLSIPNANKTYNLVYQNATLLSFIPNNDAFKVSFEKVGLVQGTNKIRGFLVLETTVGKCTQFTTTPTIPGSNVKIQVQQGISPEQVNEDYEPYTFKKEAGLYMFNIIRSRLR